MQLYYDILEKNSLSKKHLNYTLSSLVPLSRDLMTFSKIIIIRPDSEMLTLIINAYKTTCSLNKDGH